MKHRRLIAWCLLALLLLPAFAQAADVQATLDRNSVALGETVTLELHIHGDASNLAMPDLGALGSDFDMLGTSQSSSLTVVNGVPTSELTLGIVLRPKHAGTMPIPSLDIGGSRTAPLELQVAAASTASQATGQRDIFMESQVEPNHGYVGQQLSYVVKLFFATSISNGSLDAPQLNGLQVSKIGDDTNYAVERGGRQYHVLERRYAVMPQHAGHIVIPALEFQGTALDPTDPDSFFGASKPVSASAPAISVDVKPTPADWGGTAWLPARQLTLTLDGLPDAQNPVRIGQPLNLTMTMQATGLSADGLPALSLPPLDGATVYPDKANTSSRNDGPWIVGQRQQAFAVVPNRAGPLTIPATTLKWWDVLADHEAMAQIPAHTINVLPAVGSSAVPTANPTPVPTAASTGASVVSTTSVAATPWRWVAIGSLLLWLISLLAWLFLRHFRKRSGVSTAAATRHPSARDQQLAFLAVALGTDTSAQVRTLLAWARAERPSIQHLGELRELLREDRQRAAVADLQQRHYAGVFVATATTDSPLMEAFKHGFVWRISGAGDECSDLPPLYPFKLH